MKSLTQAGTFVITSLAIGLSAARPALADQYGSSAPAPTTSVTEEDPEVETFSNEKETVLGADPGANQWSGFLGLGLGLVSTSSSREASKSGLLFEGRASVSMFTRKAIFDLGLGWDYSSVSGDDSAGINTKVVTQAGALDFAGRYRFSEHFGAGPILKVMYGTDTSYSEFDQGTTAQVHFGLKAAWDYLEEDVQYRFGGQILTDLTIQNQQVWMPSVFFELGIPLSRGKTILRERETTRVEKRRIREIVREGSTFTLSEDVVHFEFNSSQLTADSQRFFQELGQFLGQNPDAYSRVRVTGHTDNVGAVEYNQKLSEDRARSVASALTAAGTPSDRVESLGQGPSQPIDTNDTDVGRARNRRVEINFGDQADGKKLHDALNRIKLRTIKPSTCTGDSCR